MLASDTEAASEGQAVPGAYAHRLRLLAKQRVLLTLWKKTSVEMFLHVESVYPNHSISISSFCIHPVRNDSISSP